MTGRESTSSHTGSEDGLHTRSRATENRNDVVRDFPGGCVPDVVLTARKTAEILHETPVVVPVEIGAVPPHEHEHLFGGFFLQEPSRQGEKVMIVVTGGVPDMNVGRDLEEAGLPDGSGVPDSQRGEKTHQVVTERSEGKGHPPHRVAHQRFQRPAVVEDLRRRDVGRNAFQMIVVDRMDGDLVIPIQGSDFGGTDPSGPVQHARIEVERPPDTVPVEYLDQPPVMDRAVVVACGQRASLSLRKETEPNTPHVPLSIRQRRPPIAP